MRIPSHRPLAVPVIRALKASRLLRAALGAILVAGVCLPLAARASTEPPVKAEAPGTSATAATAAPTATDPHAAADPRVTLAKQLPGAKPEDLRPSPIPGVYEWTNGAEIAYVSSDGKFAIDGDLYDLAKKDDLTEARRRDVRAKLLSEIPESDMLVFSPPAKDVKYTVTVFTDVDCGYCRKLHSQIADYNRLGIRVRYLFFPRTGPGTESWAKAEQVWCSADRNDALTRAKRGETIAAKPCGPNPVARDYELGKDFGVRGTPAIVLANGNMVDGYLPPPLLVKEVKQVGR
jgi:thiol:disulfide interchange protein DsbC